MKLGNRSARTCCSRSRQRFSAAAFASCDPGDAHISQQAGPTAFWVSALRRPPTHPRVPQVVAKRRHGLGREPCRLRRRRVRPQRRRLRLRPRRAVPQDVRRLQGVGVPRDRRLELLLSGDRLLAGSHLRRCKLLPRWVHSPPSVSAHPPMGTGPPCQQGGLCMEKKGQKRGFLRAWTRSLSSRSVLESGPGPPPRAEAGRFGGDWTRCCCACCWAALCRSTWSASTCARRGEAGVGPAGRVCCSSACVRCTGAAAKGELTSFTRRSSRSSRRADACSACAYEGAPAVPISARARPEQRQRHGGRTPHWTPPAPRSAGPGAPGRSPAPRRAPTAPPRAASACAPPPPRGAAVGAWPLRPAGARRRGPSGAAPAGGRPERSPGRDAWRPATGSAC